MKNALLIITAILIVSNIACVEKHTDSNSKIDTLRVSENYFEKHVGKLYNLIERGPESHVMRLDSTGAPIKILSTGLPTLVATSIPFNNAVDTATAKQIIAGYDPDDLDNNNLFIIDSGQLSNYLMQTTMGYSNYHLQFFLGYSNTDDLDLILCSVNDKADDIYFNYNGGPYSVLKLPSNSPTNNCPFQNPTSQPTAFMPRFVNSLLFSDGDTMIDNYLTYDDIDGSNISFTVEADFFNEYVNKAKAAGANQFHIYVGDNNNSLHIIICGYNTKKGQYIYLGDGNNRSCVYEQCDPCPVCDYVYNQGITLEN